MQKKKETLTPEGWVRNFLKRTSARAAAVLLASFALGAWSVFKLGIINKWNALDEVPALEQQVQKQGDMLREIRVLLVGLSNKTRHPLSDDELSKLLATVEAAVAPKTALVEKASVEGGPVDLQPAAWFGSSTIALQSPTILEQGKTTRDRRQIDRLFVDAMLAKEPVQWYAANDKLTMQVGTTGYIAIIPSKNVGADEIKEWAASLNAIRAAVIEIGETTAAESGKKTTP